MNKFERNSKITMGIENLANWKPNLKKIAEENNIAVSTVHAFYNKLLQQNRIKTWVQVLSEEEAHILFLEKRLKAQREKTNIINEALEKDFDESKGKFELR